MCVILQGFIFPLLSMAVTLKSDHPLFPETLWVSSTLPSANKSKKKKKRPSLIDVAKFNFTWWVNFCVKIIP